jgi:hypothetical protein
VLRCNVRQRGGVPVQKDVYRVRAAECLWLAGVLSDPKHKALLTEMAQAWLRLFDQAEKSRHTDVFYETPPAPGGRIP